MSDNQHRGESRSADRAPYAFPDLPLEPLPAGKNVLVSGPTHAGTGDLALRMTTGTADTGEGTVLITTNDSSSTVLGDCKRLGADFDADRFGVVDCVTDEPDETVPARVLTVSGPQDLTGIGMRYSKLCAALHEDGVERIRTGLHTVSTLLMFGDVQTISRFVHTVTGRVSSIGGIGAFVIDPETQDQRTVSTIGQFCDGRIDVRETEDGTELRVRGVPGPQEWTRFDAAIE